VLEAAHAGVPLVVITADRPASMRGTGANQTTDQVGLFGEAAPSLDVVSSDDLAAVVVGEGPVHANVQFVEPLVPASGGHLPRDRGTWPLPSGDSAREGARYHGTVVNGSSALHLPAGPRTVVVAGDDAGPPARQLAEAARWPLLAEPSSGSRTGDSAIRTYRILLAGDLGTRIERVVVFGHPTLSRPVTRLLGSGVEVVSVPPRGRWAERPHPVTRHALSVTADPDATGWFEEWTARDAEVSRALDALVEADGLGPLAVAREVSAALPPGGQLYVGASNPIRDLDLMAARYEVGRRRKVLANRGLSGIDGTVSSAIGAALTRPGARNLLLVGDVTFLHDMTALVLGPDEPRPDLTVVVVNDDGGSIFAVLEQGDPSYADRYERLFGTPHGADLAALCAATRTPHWRVESVPELRQALDSPNGGIEVVEVRCRRDNRRALDEAVRALAHTGHHAEP
jgi:2-succinyl-5-enolpyruvyl-6-hydroxy-3-cyclohexene-1-carboxylate synthase